MPNRPLTRDEWLAHCGTLAAEYAASIEQQETHDMTRQPADNLRNAILTALDEAGTEGLFAYELDALHPNPGTQVSPFLTALRRSGHIKTAKRPSRRPDVAGTYRNAACYWLSFRAPPDATFGDLRPRKPKAAKATPVPAEENASAKMFVFDPGPISPGNHTDITVPLYTQRVSAEETQEETPSVDFKLSPPSSVMQELQRVKEENAKLRAEIDALRPDPKLAAAREAVVALIVQDTSSPAAAEYRSGERDDQTLVKLALLAIETYVERSGNGV